MFFELVLCVDVDGCVMVVVLKEVYVVDFVIVFGDWLIVDILVIDFFCVMWGCV